MTSVVSINPKIMHGAPCFAGTRVAVKTFFDHVEAGYTLDEFLEQFPTEKREQVVALLEALESEVAKMADAA